MKQETKIILMVVSGSIMIAHGLRMMTQGIFYPQSFYPAPVPSSFDFWFDWFTLAGIGSMLFFIGVQSFYHQLKKQRSQKMMVLQAT